MYMATLIKMTKDWFTFKFNHLYKGCPKTYATSLLPASAIYPTSEVHILVEYEGCSKSKLIKISKKTCNLFAPRMIVSQGACFCKYFWLVAAGLIRVRGHRQRKIVGI